MSISFVQFFNYKVTNKYLPEVRIWDKWLIYLVANCNVSIFDSLRSGGLMGIIVRRTLNAELTLKKSN